MRRLERFRFLAVVCIPVLIAGLLEVYDPDGVGSELEPEQFQAEWRDLYPEHDHARRLEARELIRVGQYQEARELLEAVIATEVKTNEDVLYDYITLLKTMDAAQADIDAAVELWRRNYPHSQYADP